MSNDSNLYDTKDTLEAAGRIVKFADLCSTTAGWYEHSHGFKASLLVNGKNVARMLLDREKEVQSLLRLVHIADEATRDPDAIERFRKVYTEYLTEKAMASAPKPAQRPKEAAGLANVSDG
jgi:hypothetical protein